jgi:hypothetical protein
VKKGEKELNNCIKKNEQQVWIPGSANGWMARQRGIYTVFFRD